MTRTRRLTHIAIYVALALVLHVAESFIPVPFMVPGAKLGLANIVTLLVILLSGTYDALVVVALRTFLGSLLSGALTSFAFSIVGGVLATIVMSLVYKRLGGVFGLVGVSILGAISHNIGQLLVAGVVVGTMGVYGYLPVLLVAGVATGYFVGIAAGFVLRFLPKALAKSAAAGWPEDARVDHIARMP
ncbi:MAG: Gx transporter family protein [Bacillota bacterium]|nr:Gx transporter family protein [Bacillota bacterium]